MFAIGISITESKIASTTSYIPLSNSCVKVLLTMRTWAIWGKDHRLTIILPILWALCFGGVFTFMGFYLKSVSCECFFLALYLAMLIFYTQSSHPLEEPEINQRDASTSVAVRPYSLVGCSLWLMI